MRPQMSHDLQVENHRFWGKNSEDSHSAAVIQNQCAMYHSQMGTMTFLWMWICYSSCCQTSQAIFCACYSSGITFTGIRSITKVIINVTSYSGGNILSQTWLILFSLKSCVWNRCRQYLSSMCLAWPKTIWVWVDFISLQRRHQVSPRFTSWL